MSESTLFGKVWSGHVVSPETESTPAILYMDLHLVHEVTSPQAFEVLRKRGLRVRRPDRTVATMDHSTPTTPRPARGPRVVDDQDAKAQIDRLERNCRDQGIRLYALGDDHQGIVHVIAPELGLTRPGMTITCGDSHTSTHGAFGALAFGIGTSEVGHVLATQCLLQRRPRTMRATVDGKPSRGVTAKDVVLALIAKIGTAGGARHVIEYAGSTVRAMNMEERMTVCNMTIEGGARAGMVAPDDTTFEWLAGCPETPRGALWERDLSRWRGLRSDDDALFDREVSLDASVLSPMITFGTDPATAIPIGSPVPEANGDATRARALAYMGVEAGKPLLGHRVDVVFIGSCTNARLSDLRQAATVMRGRRVAPGVRMLVVAGSQQVKSRAEAEGLDRVFRDAGAEWREPGCSMCIAMNGDRLDAGQYAVSTSNRNFEGRQGPGGRTFLASPLTAAAAAVTGRVTDVRELVD
ncbi:MAG TPA: 3-isopropylmalate dehydratase large subunit [Polyangiaceae bacterium]|nr:3-isopropylmalate dehydratase large subunit [Polyangiaceae bacterium]